MSSGQQQPAVQRITPSRAELTQEVSFPQHSLHCSLCNMPFRSSSNLRFHMIKTHRCTDPSAAMAAIASTASSQASAESISLKRYHCPEFNCRYSELNGEYFSSFSRVKQHYSWKHLEKKSQCDYCSRRFPSQALLRLHVRDCGRFFNCEECSRFYRDLKNLRSHFKKTGHGLNSIFSQRTRRSPSELQQQQQLRKQQKQKSSTRTIDLDDCTQQPSVGLDVSNSFSSTVAVGSGGSEAGNSSLNLVIVVTGLGGSTPTATVSAVSSTAAVAAASAASSSGKADSASAASNSRYRQLAPRPLPTTSRSSQTDPSPSPELLAALLQQHQQHAQQRQPLVQQQHHHHQQMFSRSHHHTGPIMVPNHASFRGSSCSSFAVVSIQDVGQQHQQQSTMHTQTEYTSPIATEGYSVGVQYSHQQQQQQQQHSQPAAGVTHGVCVGSGASPPITLGIQAGPDPLEQLLDMETQTNDAFCSGGGGFAGCEMETQTYEEFDWDTMFGIVNRRSTGVG